MNDRRHLKRLRPALAQAAFAITACCWLAPQANAYVYWGNGTGGVSRAGLDSGGVTAGWIPTASAYGVAADSQHVYYAGFALSAIGRANLDGSNPSAFFIPASSPYGIAVDGQHVYWTNFWNGTIGRANLDGTGAN